jgi:asparagine synthase (glutamine-hydrolysing)
VGALAPGAARAIMAAPPAGDPYDVIDERLARCPSSDRWDQLLYFYAKGFLGDQVLAKVDRATMAVGLEARAPLVSPSLVSFTCALAPSLRLRGLTTKYLLKRAIRLLPDEILDRRKQGFSMPVALWLRGPLRPLLEET